MKALAVAFLRGACLSLPPACVLAAGAYALAVGALSLRTRGVYFIMVTLAFAQMAYYVFHDTKLGGGSDGIYLYFRPTVALGDLALVDLDNPRSFYWFVLGMLVASFAFLALLGRSRFGHALAGIKANEQRMRAVGFRTYGYKLAAFVMSAALTGLAGGVKALVFQFATLTDVGWQMSGEVILMTLLGGIGTLIGPLFGAGLVVTLQNYLATSEFPVTIITGLVFMVCVLLFRRGIVGEFYNSRLGRKLGFEHRQ